MTQTPELKSVRDLVLLWGPAPQSAYENMACDLGRDYAAHMPRDWARRGRIPVEHVDPIVNAAQRRGFHEVTHALVLKLIRESVAA